MVITMGTEMYNMRDLARGDDKNTLNFLAETGDKITRYFVACNESTPDETLLALSGDRLTYIRSAAKRTLAKHQMK